MVRVLIVNSQLGGDFAETGPNAAPTQGAGTRTCNEYSPRIVDDHGASVRVAGPNLALSHTAYWVQQHASRHAPVALWHLLTDCFPRDGTTGLSEFGVLCEQGATAVRYADGGPETSLTADGGCAGVSVSSLRVTALVAPQLSSPTSSDASVGFWAALCTREERLSRPARHDGRCHEGRCCMVSVVCALMLAFSRLLTRSSVHPSGHCARMEVLPAQQPCSEDMLACRAPAGVSSNGPELWRTVAHEVSHALLRRDMRLQPLTHRAAASDTRVAACVA